MFQGVTFQVLRGFKDVHMIKKTMHTILKMNNPQNINHKKMNLSIKNIRWSNYALKHGTLFCIVLYSLLYLT